MEIRLREAQSVVESRERNLNEREIALEEKNRNMLANARQEAMNNIKSEMEVIANEKSQLLFERKKVVINQNSLMFVIPYC